MTTSFVSFLAHVSTGSRVSAGALAVVGGAKAGSVSTPIVMGVPALQADGENGNGQLTLQDTVRADRGVRRVRSRATRCDNLMLNLVLQGELKGPGLQSITYRGSEQDAAYAALDASLRSEAKTLGG